jgi:hypothetical protein
MKIPLTFVAVTLAAAAIAAKAPEISEAVLRGYQQSMHKMNAQPHSVDTGLAILCKIPPEAEAAQKRDGLHYGHWINVYMNELARKQFEAKSADPYPPGSIILKEKLLSALPAHSDMTAIAGLIKHAPGYNKATGDWEFFYAEANGKMERGGAATLASCARCHQNAPGDYVFGDFAKPAAPPKTPAL